MSPRDVFGKAILDVFKGKKVTITIRRDDGRLDQENGNFYFTKFDQFPTIEKQSMNLVNGLILDVGCGAGRHTLYLQAKRFDVGALDISPLAIRVARKRGVSKPILAAAPWLPFRDETFDTLLLMFNNFGICGGYRETIRYLKELKRILKTGGCVLASSLHPALTDDESHLRYHELNRKRGLPIGLVTLRLEYGGEAGEWFKLLLASPEEMKMLSAKAASNSPKRSDPPMGLSTSG
ncbi:MAG: class I SAM-dependent methyltransferase [Candidatus Bathyarchaeia archaeon]